MKRSKVWRGIEDICCNYTPVVITVCYVLAMLLMYVVGAKYNVQFHFVIDKEVFDFYGVAADLWKRFFLLFIAVLSSLPYILSRRGKCEDFNTWVKLGLILTAAVCFFSAVAVMDDKFDFLVSALERADEGVLSEPLFSYVQQNRFILTTPQNILLPLSLCVLLSIFEERRKRSRAETTVCVLLASWGMLYMDPGIWWYDEQIWKNVVFLSAALVISCVLSMRRKDGVDSKKTDESRTSGLRIGDIVLLGLCSIVALIYVVYIFYLYGSNSFQDIYDRITSVVVAFMLMPWLIIHDKYKKKLKSPTFRTIVKSPEFRVVLKFLPALLLILIAFVGEGEYFFWRGRMMFRGEYYDKFYNYYFTGYVHYIKFFDCIACLVYVMYILYDYGMKEHPKLYVGITALVIIMAHIPNFEVPIGAGMESISVVNILIGLLSPALVIAFGLINWRKARKLRD